MTRPARQYRERADSLRGVVEAERAAAMASSGSSDWLAYGRAAIGSDGHVREHTIATIGRAIGEGATDAEIEDGLIELIEPFGGLARIDEYGGLDGWLRRSIRDIRRREIAQLRAAETTRARLDNFLKSAAKKG